MACEHTDVLETLSEYPVFIRCRLSRAVLWLLAELQLLAELGPWVFGHARSL